MVKTKILCQHLLLARDPNPAENRVYEESHPVEFGKITGFSLAPRYSLKQLRSIERRKTKTKLDSRFERMQQEERS